MLDDPGKRHAANLAAAQRLLVLAAEVLHHLGLEDDALVRQDAGHVDAQHGLLHDEQARELDGVVDEDAEGRVAGGRAGGRGQGREEGADAGDDALRVRGRLGGEVRGGFAAEEGEG